MEKWMFHVNETYRSYLVQVRAQDRDIFGPRSMSTDNALPTGPKTRTELGKWDDRLGALLMAKQLAKPVYVLLRSGVLYHSEYSGYDSPAEGLRMFLPTLAHLLGEPTPDFTITKAADWGPAQQFVLKRASADMHDFASCVLGDISERLHPDALALVEGLAPKKHLKDGAGRNKQIDEYLLKNRQWAAPLSATSWCFVHHRPCPVHPGFVWSHVSNNTIPEMLQSLQTAKDNHLGEPAPRTLKRKLPEYVPPLGMKPWWQRVVEESESKRAKASSSDSAASSCPQPWRQYRRPDTASFEDTQHDEEKISSDVEKGGFDAANAGSVIGRPLIIVAGGLTCTDYSPQGQRKGCAGETERHHAVFIADRITSAEAGLEDLAFTEQAEHYPIKEKQRKPLASTHQVVFARGSPVNIGFPVRRTRCLGAAIARSTLVWVGPDTDDAVQDEFMSLMGSTCELDGDMYFMASKVQVAKFSYELASSRKKVLPDNFEDMHMEEYLHKIVPPGAVDRKGEWDLVRENHPQIGSFLADIDHHPHRGLVAGQFFPVALTHHKIWSWQRRRMAIPSEVFCAQGVDTLPGLAGGRTISPLTSIFDDLPVGDRSLLAGNALHIPLFTMWMMYVMGKCVPIKDFYKMDAKVTSPATGSGDDSADDAEA